MGKSPTQKLCTTQVTCRHFNRLSHALTQLYLLFLFAGLTRERVIDKVEPSASIIAQLNVLRKERSDNQNTLYPTLQCLKTTQVNAKQEKLLVLSLKLDLLFCMW